MKSVLHLLSDEDPMNNTLIARDYNCIRPFINFTLGEVLAMAYVEALTYQEFIGHRVYLQTYINRNDSEFPSLTKYLNELGSKVLPFGKFYEKKLQPTLVQEIKNWGRALVSDDGVYDLIDFSKRFNAVITYFIEDRDVIEIVEHQYMDPIEVAVFQRNGLYSVVYPLTEEGSPILKRISPIEYKPEDFDLLERIGKLMINIIWSEELSKDTKNKLYNDIERIRAVAKHEWQFLETYNQIRKIDESWQVIDDEQNREGDQMINN